MFRFTALFKKRVRVRPPYRTDAKFVVVQHECVFKNRNTFPFYITRTRERRERKEIEERRGGWRMEGDKECDRG